MAVGDRDPYLLPCGRDADTLWGHLGSGGLDYHERSCPHCQTAAAGLHALRRATGQLAQLDTTPPPELTQRIMRAVHAERRTSPGIVLEATHLGISRITASAAAVVIRFAASHDPDATAGAATIESLPALGPDQHRVRISLSLRYGAYATEATVRVRQLVRTAARDLVGFEAARIDIDITDVTDPDESREKRS